jgi:hypothetical protein
MASRMRHASLCLPLLTCLLTSGCVDDAMTGIEDGEHDDFAAGKADGPAEGSADAKLLLAFVNDPSVNEHELVAEVGLTRRLSRNIIAHLVGPDEVHGTADDTLFESIAALDAVPYLGPVSMGRLLARARETRTTAKLTIEIFGTDWASGGHIVDVAAINVALANEGLPPLPATLTLGARDDRAFMALEATLAELNARAERAIEIAQHWDPSEYRGLCYQGPIDEVERVIEGLYGSLFSNHMGIQGVRHGATKRLYVMDHWDLSEAEWMEMMRDAGNDADIDDWHDFDTASDDFLIMTDGGPDGDGTELFAVTIPPCRP